MRTFKSLMLSGDACRENCLFMLKTPILNTWELHESWNERIYAWWWWNDKTENECMFFSNIDFTNGILIHSTNLQPISFFSSHIMHFWSMCFLWVKCESMQLNLLLQWLFWFAIWKRFSKKDLKNGTIKVRYIYFFLYLL